MLIANYKLFFQLSINLPKPYPSVPNAIIQPLLWIIKLQPTNSVIFVKKTCNLKLCNEIRRNRKHRWLCKMNCWNVKQYINCVRQRRKREMTTQQVKVCAHMNTTRHSASTSMYSLTFCVRVMMPKRHQWEARSPGRRSNVENAPSTASHWPASHAHFPYTARNIENAPVTRQQRVHTPPSVRTMSLYCGMDEACN